MASLQDKMIKVRPIIYVQSNTELNGYGIADFGKVKDTTSIESSVDAPYLVLFIEPSPSGDSVQQVQAVFNDGMNRYTKTLDTEVQNVGLFLNSETLKQSTSLVDKVNQYLSFYTEQDVLGMSLPPVTDNTGFIVDPTSSLSQMGMDAFVIGMAGYLASLTFLMEEDIYSNLPFPFTLPFHTVGENVLNTNMFKYMSYPCTAVVTHSTYCDSRILFDQILRFCNEWGPIFDDGPVLDFSTAVMDTTSGYCKLVVTDLSTFQENILFMRDEMVNTQTEIVDIARDTRNTAEQQIREMRNSIEEIRTSTSQQFIGVLNEIQTQINLVFAQKEAMLKQNIENMIAKELVEFREKVQNIFLEEFEEVSSSIKSRDEKRKHKSRHSHEKRKSRSRRRYDSNSRYEA